MHTTNTRTRRRNRLLAIMLAFVLTANCLVLPSMAAQADPDETTSLITYAGEDAELISHTETEVTSVDSSIPEGAVKISEDDNYDYYQITDAKAISKLMESYGISSEEVAEAL